jgi:hypothetical protein
MRQCGRVWKRITVLLVLVGLFSTAGSPPAGAEQPTSSRDAAWVWGYVISGKLPGDVPFVGEGGSRCSLETAATYLGAPNVVLMGVNWTDAGYIERVAKDMERLAGCKRVLVQISASEPALAAKVSALSKRYPNIVGAMIDDFYPVEEKIPVETVKAVYAGLKSENPALKLYVVRYTHCKDEELIPYLPYFDVVNLWVWVANKEQWVTKIDARIEKLKQVTHKPVVMGLFLHDYGMEKTDPKAAQDKDKEKDNEKDPWAWTKPVPMDILEAQFVKTAELLRQGKIEGFIMLQNGWMDHESHRPQIQWTKQYLDWLFQTETVRDGK